MKALFDRVAALTRTSYGQLDAIQQDSERRFAEVATWFSLQALATPAGNARAIANIEAIRNDFTRRQALQAQLMKDLEQLYATAPGLTSTERSELRQAHADAVAQLKARQSQMDAANLAYNDTMKSIAQLIDAERRAGRLGAGADGRPAFATTAQPKFDALVAQLTEQEARVNQLDASIRQDSANARAGVTNPPPAAR